MLNPFVTKPQMALELIQQLDHIHPAIKPDPGDMVDPEAQADLMYRAGKRDLIDNLMVAYKLKEADDGILES